MLLCDFKDLPGESFVAIDSYHIFDVRGPSRGLTRLNWSRYAYPGMKIKMSMIMSTIPFQRRACPRCKCTKYQESQAGIQETFSWYELPDSGVSGITDTFKQTLWTFLQQTSIKPKFCER